jgi:hypothetical protein
MSTHLNLSRDTKEMVLVLLALTHMVEEILATYTIESLILAIIAGDLKEVLAVVYPRTLLLVMQWVLFHPPITMAFLLYTSQMCQQIHCPPPQQY